MTSSTDLSRRRFLRGTTVAGASLAARGWSRLARGDSPAERIRIGVIGTGVRGKYLIGNLPKPAQITAICDCARSRMADTLEPRGEFAEILSSFRDDAAQHCATYQDYRRMIDREPLDAVIIATPDHHHVQAAIPALQAGLDVYLEKPLSVTIREGRVLADVVEQTGRVLQVGSQQRTMEVNRFACEFIRKGGLGTVHRIDFPNYPGPLLTADFPGEPVPEGLDWGLFLGPAPYRAHHRNLWVKDEFNVGDLLWRGWDLYRDYSGHLMTNWGAHSIDMVQYALGQDNSGPVRITPCTVSDRRAESASGPGGSPANAVSVADLQQDWDDKWHEKTPHPAGSWLAARRFHPVSLEYADGTRLDLRPGVEAATFYGERGTMAISRNRYRTDPPDLIPDVPNSAVGEKWDGAGHVARPHLQNWLDCMRSRGVPHAPVEVGHRTVTVCHLVNIARETGRQLHWNPDEELFVGDDEANELLERPRRKGFELPV